MADNTDFYTVTMAKIYAEQGHFNRAEEIYRYLLSVEPGRQDLVKELESVRQQAAKSGMKSLASLEPLIREWIKLLLKFKNVQKLKGISGKEPDGK